MGKLSVIVLVLMLAVVNSISFFGGGKKTATTVKGEEDQEDYDDEDYDDFHPITNTTPITSPAPTVPLSLWDTRVDDPDVDHSDVDTCVPLSLSVVQWILSVRQSDYGWREDTHRAIIALSVSGWPEISGDEKLLMELQLEVEITRALLRNETSAIYPNDMALYIHALMAIQRNPRQFYGIDLVLKLQDSVSAAHYRVHPFLLLALCNADALPANHLNLISSYLRDVLLATDSPEHLALTLMAYECLETMNYKIDKTAAAKAKNKVIVRQLTDGSFGNVYTTAFVVQALASSDTGFEWRKDEALEYLRPHEAATDANMVSSYLIQLAVNAERVKFIKHLHKNLALVPVYTKEGETAKRDHFISYTLKIGRHPNAYRTVALQVSPNTNFYDIMKMAEKYDPKFSFSSSLNRDNKPSIYSISGVPNDAEHNLYWRLCIQSNIDHKRHTYQFTTVRDSPVTLIPKQNEHIIYWYRDSDCKEYSRT